VLNKDYIVWLGDYEGGDISLDSLLLVMDHQLTVTYKDRRYPVTQFKLVVAIPNSELMFLDGSGDMLDAPMLNALSGMKKGSLFYLREVYFNGSGRRMKIAKSQLAGLIK